MSNVQGTILAPNAHITDIKMKAGDSKYLTYNGIEYYNGGVNPHLSGALIAQDFEGYTEMGYRPFNGPVSIAGKGSDGSITVTKKIEQSGARLNGTTLSLYEGKIKLTYWWGVNALKDFQLEIKTPPTVPDTNVITAEGRTLTFVNNKISQITFRKVDDSRIRSGRGGEDSIPAPKPVAGAKMVLTAPEGTDRFPLP